LIDIDQSKNGYLKSILESLYIYTLSQKKLCQCYILNNSVKRWPTLIIFGMRHHKWL